MIRALARFFAAIFAIGVLLGLGVYFVLHEFNAAGPAMAATAEPGCGVVDEEAAAFATARDHPLAPPGRIVTIAPNTGIDKIADKLVEAGVLEPGNQWIFVLGTRLYRSNGQLKAGQYSIPSRASAHDIMETLREGRTVAYGITVPEGRTSAQIVEMLNGDPRLSGPPITEVPPEGSLLPETYNFTCGDPRQSILDRMRNQMDQTLNELWPDRDPDLPIETPEQAVVLASIIEKETGVADERPQIASVFINRLRRGMKLQTDPTVIYALTQGKSDLGRPLTRADLTVDSPYNTYRIDGLPPGPITNPGRDAIAAALHPDPTDFLYFVAQDDEHPRLGHLFATSKSEHDRNVARLNELREQRRNASQGG